MNRQIIKRIWTLVSAILIVSSVSYAQFDNTDFLMAGPVDGVKIAEAYIAPWVNAFGAGVNGNWYNTAKPHKFGGFDITAGFNFGFVPSSATTFDVANIGLTEFSGTGMAPTVAGPKSDGPTLTAIDVPAGLTPVSFQTPPGSDWKTMPVPSLQVGIGLPLSTEVKIRYIPNVPIGGGDISSWGVGILHSIMQYLPGDKILPFDISLFGGYTKLNGNLPLDMQPDSYANYSSAYNSASFQNQNLSAVVKAWNASLIGSFNLPVISFYGGLGYSSTSSVIEMTGNFPLPTYNPAISTEPVYEDAGVLKDFPKMDIKNFSGLRTNIGFRLKFGIFTIHGDYTWAQYSVLATGLGISFR